MTLDAKLEVVALEENGMGTVEEVGVGRSRILALS